MEPLPTPRQHTVSLPTGERFHFAWTNPKQIDVYLRGFPIPIDVIKFVRPILTPRFSKEIHRWVDNYRYRKSTDPLLRRMA